MNRTAPRDAASSVEAATVKASPDPRAGLPEAWTAALAALQERIDRLETDVRHLQSQIANRA